MPEFNSAHYWEYRYKSGGNSGSGSYGRLAQFKAQVVNDFVVKNKVRAVIEFGVGDGNQLSFYKFDHYLGFDVSPFVIDKLRNMYAHDQGKAFLLTSEYAGQSAELSLSVDVIFHLVEEEVFDLYMRRLFQAAEKYVIIYSSNQQAQEALVAPHFKHRLFTEWINANCPEWELANKIDNPFPYTGKDSVNTSTADFFFYRKK